MSEFGKPTISSLAEEKARLIARLEKIAQLEKLAGELGVSISGEFGTMPTFSQVPKVPFFDKAQSFDGTIAGLVQCYRTDERSPDFKLKHPGPKRL